MKTSSLKRKFITFAVITIIPILTSSILSLIITKKINENYNLMLNKISAANQIRNYISDSLYNFNKYIYTNSIEAKELYEANYNKAAETASSLELSSDSQSTYILRNLLNCLKSYKESGDNTINIYDTKNTIDAYYEGYVSTEEVWSFCSIYISKLRDSYIDYNNNVYNNLKQKEKYIYLVLAIYIITALMISTTYTIFFLRNILDKLRELADTSKKVSSGNFAYYKGKKTFIYELDILSEAFGTMISDIKKYINSLKENVELERKIRDNEMKLLKYENALKQSQLKVLQSQINPHFLFNTLNCINQTAIKENATITESLITSVSGILRYSLSMMNRNVTLEEEVDLVKRYIYIQQLRYEDRIKFNLNINMDLSKVKVPGMTIQPFVENAFIHGIEPKEEGGTINIDIYEEGDFCIVLIEDNGCGIDEETLSRIISRDPLGDHKGHTTGIGIRSVVERLELMYDRNDMFRIESMKGYGTKIYLKIPIERQASS